MEKRKKPKDPREFWDHFFGESFDEFVNMRRLIEKMFHDSMRRSVSDKEPGKPFIYGISVRIGPDGIPHFQHFGNTKFSKRFRGDKAGKHEREPLTDIIDHGDHVAITMELPGVEKKDINMEIFEDSMTISVDSGLRKFHKELKLPENLDPDSVKANYKNGVLEIIIKRKTEEPRKGKKIKID
jgi:HSP20 family protein